MIKQVLKGIVFIVITVFLVGCATGKTEFRLIPVSPTPEQEMSVTLTPVSPQNAVEEIKPDGSESLQKTYTVVAGDSLSAICKKWYGNADMYHQLAKRNHISNPDLIEPGQILLLDTTHLIGKPPKVNADHVQTVQPTLLTKLSLSAGTSSVTPPTEFPIRINEAFGVGERLHFSVEYFGISAGYATLSVNSGPKINDRETFHIVAEARTHPAFEWIFKVRDRIETFFDKQSLFSWRYEKHLREGNYSNDSFMIYDQLKQKVIKDKGRTIIDAPPLVQDVLSEFYFYRTLEQGIGDKTTIPVLADDGKNYEVLVKVVRQEKVRVPAGEFDCLVVEPYLKFEGVFKHQGKIHIWLTNDKRRVPVLIKSGIVIGTIDIVLRDAVVVDLADQ